jgi:hypothetical protein
MTSNWEIIKWLDANKNNKEGCNLYLVHINLLLRCAILAHVSPIGACLARQVLSGKEDFQELTQCIDLMNALVGPNLQEYKIGDKIRKILTAW